MYYQNSYQSRFSGVYLVSDPEGPGIEKIQSQKAILEKIKLSIRNQQ